MGSTADLSTKKQGINKPEGKWIPIIQSEEQEMSEEKWTEPKESAEHHPAYHHNG